MRILHIISLVAVAAVVSAQAQPLSGPQPTSADSTIARYCAAWAITDPGARAAVLADVWAENGEYVDPQPIRVVGRTALAEQIVQFQRDQPGSTFRCSTGQVHHDFVRYTWVMVGANGNERFQGADFGQLDASGRLVRIVSFFGAAPSVK